MSAGLYIAGLFNKTSEYYHLGWHLPPEYTAAAFAIGVVVYFWWQNIKGIHESSHKALRIMQITYRDGGDPYRLVPADN